MKDISNNKIKVSDYVYYSTAQRNTAKLKYGIVVDISEDESPRKMIIKNQNDRECNVHYNEHRFIVVDLSQLPIKDRAFFSVKREQLMRRY